MAGNRSRRAEEYVSKGGHDYRPDLRVVIFKFINNISCFVGRHFFKYVSSFVNRKVFNNMNLCLCFQLFKHISCFFFI